jgi:hypothetical protein
MSGSRHLPWSAVLFAVAVCLSPRAAGAQPCALWRGKIGEREVAVSLRSTGGAALAGRYAYLHIGKAIPLAGTRNGAGLALEERGGRAGQPSGSWALSPSATAADALAGSWRAPDGKRTATIALTCLGTADGKLRDPWYAANLPGDTSDQQFDALLRDPVAPESISEGLEGTSAQHIRDLSAADEYDLVLRHPFARAAADLNAAIRAEVAGAKKAERECRSEGRRCEITANVRIDFLSPRFATVSIDGYYDGGGAHPDTSRTIWVFAMTEAGGRRVQMDRVYQLQGSDGSFTPAFARLMRAGEKSRDNEGLEPGDCDDLAVTATVQLGVTSDGIDVDVSYTSHAIAACGYSFTLKVSQMVRFLRPGAPAVFRTGKF